MSLILALVIALSSTETAKWLELRSVLQSTEAVWYADVKALYALECEISKQYGAPVPTQDWIPNPDPSAANKITSHGVIKARDVEGEGGLYSTFPAKHYIDPSGKYVSWFDKDGAHVQPLSTVQTKTFLELTAKEDKSINVTSTAEVTFWEYEESLRVKYHVNRRSTYACFDKKCTNPDGQQAVVSIDGKYLVRPN